MVERFGEMAGSWLNQAEIAIRLFSRQWLGRRRIPDQATLRTETRLGVVV
jgi:hypothetical protein